MNESIDPNILIHPYFFLDGSWEKIFNNDYIIILSIGVPGVFHIKKSTFQIFFRNIIFFIQHYYNNVIIVCSNPLKQSIQNK